MKLRFWSKVRAVATALMLALSSIAPEPALPHQVAPANHNFASLVRTAQQSATSNQPGVALAYYDLAFQAAGTNEARQRIALFGIGRMLLWLGKYHRSREVYEHLLSTNLSTEDREIALAGLVESLTDVGQPMAAYKAAGEHARAQNPRLAVQLARAADAAGWPDKANDVLVNSADLTQTVDPVSRLGLDLRSLKRQLAYELNPRFGMGYAFSNDSDGFHVGRMEAHLSDRAGRVTMVNAVFDRVSFRQGTWQTDGSSVFVGGNSRLGDHIWAGADFGAEDYGGWQSPAYHASLTVRPNDTYRLRVVASRDPVQTQLAITQRLTSWGTDLDGDVSLGSSGWFSTSIYRQNFSDSNLRMNFSQRIGKILSDAAGLSANLRWRSFSDTVPGSNAYFDPQHYSNVDLLLTESHPVGQNFRVNLTGGVGRQTVMPGTTSTTALYEASIKGWGRGCLSVQASLDYSNSAVATSSGYQRHSTDLSASCAVR